MVKPVVKHSATVVTVKGKQIPVRIMLIKYDGNIEVYYQEEGYPYGFAYGIPDHVGFKDVMKMAIVNAEIWGIHHDYI